MMNAINVAGRTFVALRKSGRPKPGHDRIFHAVTPHCRMALCAVEPGAGSGWEELPHPEVTCKECRKRLDRLAGIQNTARA
jgi:hypothetical protein